MRYVAASIIGVGALGLILYLYAAAPKFYPDENTLLSSPIVSLPSAGTREYKSILFRFALSYPKDLQVQEYSEGSATTIAFEDPSSGYGFQIFIVPYLEDQISPERFAMDVPSGVMMESTGVMVNGTRATMFYSKNAVMGDTREVWFVKNGFLYEVTTYKALDHWLAKILSAWTWNAP